MKALKKAAYEQVLSLLDDKIITAEKAVLSAKESRDNETKSSAGDKHETGRAMSQIELFNSENQLSKVLNLKKQFLQIDFSKEQSSVELGSMVKSNHGIYLMSIGLGNIEVNGQNCYVISMQSPIGQAMQHKRIGDQFSFQNKLYEIEEVL